LRWLYEICSHFSRAESRCDGHGFCDIDEANASRADCRDSERIAR
jgi:hypothetical protein